MRRLLTAFLTVAALGAAAPAHAGAPDARMRLGIVDTTTGAHTVLLTESASDGRRGWRSLRFTAGGAGLLAHRRRDARLVHVPAAGGAPALGRRVAVERAAVSPDGTRIAELRLRRNRRTLVVADLAGREVARHALGPEGYGATGLAWSRKGERIAVLWDDRHVEKHLAIVDAATGRPVRRVRVGDPAEIGDEPFSPDASQVALALQPEEDLSDLAAILEGRDLRDDRVLVLDVATGRRRTLLRPHTIVSDVAWSPASDAVAAAGNVTWLALMPGGPRVLPPFRGAEIHQVAWAPDGRSVAVAWGGDFARTPVEIHLVGPDGAARRLADIGAGELDELEWSPDGTGIAYAITGHRDDVADEPF